PHPLPCAAAAPFESSILCSSTYCLIDLLRQGRRSPFDYFLSSTFDFHDVIAGDSLSFYVDQEYLQIGEQVARLMQAPDRYPVGSKLSAQLGGELRVVKEISNCGISFRLCFRIDYDHLITSIFGQSLSKQRRNRGRTLQFSRSAGHRSQILQFEIQHRDACFRVNRQAEQREQAEQSNGQGTCRQAIALHRLLPFSVISSSRGKGHASSGIRDPCSAQKCYLSCCSAILCRAMAASSQNCSTKRLVAGTQVNYVTGMHRAASRTSGDMSRSSARSASSPTSSRLDTEERTEFCENRLSAA